MSALHINVLESVLESVPENVLANALKRGVRRIMLCLCLLILAGCVSMDFDRPKAASHNVPVSSNTVLGKYALDWMSKNPGESGFVPIVDGTDALAARLYLADRATESLDLQYFLVKNDRAGKLMANALLEAADRGVKVRLLFDDVFTTAPDTSLQQLDEHPNIELRIFNPISRKGFKWGNYALTFRRSNRRMHNKVFSADGAVLLVGGRNIADEYFHIGSNDVFLDFDVMLVGEVSIPIRESFDEYWNHKLAMPMSQVRKRAPNKDLATIRNELNTQVETLKKTVYAPVLEKRTTKEFLADPKFYKAKASFTVDSPDKLLPSKSTQHQELAQRLALFTKDSESEVLIMSPYFIPGKRGMKMVRALIAQGKKVKIVTNSLASNNHMSAYSAYSRYRKQLLRAGAELYEIRVDAMRYAVKSGEEVPNITMHTKALIFDQNTLFAGSVNLDPRSININSELGIFMPSEPMVEDLLGRIDNLLTRASYKVELDDRGFLIWRANIDGNKVIYKTNPQTTLFTRTAAALLRIVPEGQL